MYLLTHSLVLVLVLVAVMKPKVLKTKISHADPPTLSHSLCYKELKTKISHANSLTLSLL